MPMDTLPPPVIEIVVSNQGMDKGLLEEDGVQVVGGIRFDLGKNVYIRGSAKNVDGLSKAEADAAIGARTSVAGVALTGEVAYKRMIDPLPGADNEAVEFNASAARQLGPVHTTVSVSYSPNALGLAKKSVYVEGTGRVALDSKMTLVGSVGHAERDNAEDYTSYSVGAEYALTKNITGTVRYHDTARDELGRAYGDRVIAGVRFNF